MALRSLLDRYKSISRPSLSSGSGTYSSLAKKQASAEDAIIDNQYKDGNLSAEKYSEYLQSRLLRSWITPLQQVSIQEKIKSVGEAITDAEVSRQYAAGTATTSQVYQYEKAKLDKMTEPGSTAYIQQQQKVQGLLDKAEREGRTATRIAENLRISKLPEDTSANIWAKANLYSNLADQARLDGDTQQADVFETQKNNYLNNAKKADINDLLTSTRLSVSQTSTGGMGVPSAESGQSWYRELTGQKTVPSGGTASVGGQSPNGATTSPAAVSTGFSGTSSPAIRNAFESLDRGKKTLDRLYQEKADKQGMVQAYQNAINQASGDQKTQLTIALNNLVDGLATTDNQIAITTQGLQDTVVKIQEAQQKAAASAFNQEVRKVNLNFTKAESELETDFTKGKIDKYEYIQKGTELAGTKAQFLDEASGVFNQFGNDMSAETYLQKASEMQKIHEGLISVAQNVDDYEPIQVDPGGKVTNLLGKTVQPGDIALTNVRQLKDSGQFEANYANMDGVWKQIHYPGEVSSVTGLPTTPSFNKESGRLQNKAFVYKLDDNGKSVAEPIRSVTFLDENNNPSQKFISEEQYKQMEGVKTLNQKPNTQAVDFLNQSKKALGTILKPYQSPIDAGNMVGQAINTAKGYAGKVKGFFDQAVSKFQKQGGIVKPVSAAEQKQFEDEIAQAWGVEAEVAHKILTKENANYDPSLFIANRIDPKTGKWSNTAPVMKRKDPLTGQWIESIDGGLFRHNNITVNDYLKRFPNEMHAIGIYRFEDVADPIKSAKLAKLTYDKQGLGAWHAFDEDLANNTFETDNYKAQATPTPNGKSIYKIVEKPKPTPTQMPTPTPTTSLEDHTHMASPIPGGVRYEPPLGDRIIGAVQTVTQAPQKIASYFNPESNKGQNFWSTPTAQALGNVQKYTQPVYNFAKAATQNVVVPAIQKAVSVAKPVVQSAISKASSWLNSQSWNPFRKK